MRTITKVSGSIPGLNIFHSISMLELSILYLKSSLYFIFTLIRAGVITIFGIFIEYCIFHIRGVVLGMLLSD